MTPAPLPPRAGPIVDADGHVVEPPSAWADLPDAHRPQVHRDRSGYEHVTVGDQEILAVPLGTLARPGSTFDDPATYRPLEEAQPGGSDPVARLADMDSEGIDQAVLYPSIGLYAAAIADPVAAVAVARAYNDWLASYCAAAPRRLFGAAMLPLQDPAAAAGRAAARRHRAGLPGGLRPAQPLPGPLPVGPGLRPGVGRGRGIGCPHRGSRGELGDHPDPGIGPALQPAHPPRRLPFLRGDAGLCPTHRPGHLRAPPRTAVHLPGVLRRVGALLAGAARRAGRVLRGLLPRPEARTIGVLRPAVRHQLRGRRAHPARP